jgi:hypothetical protein
MAPIHWSENYTFFSPSPETPVLFFTHRSFFTPPTFVYSLPCILCCVLSLCFSFKLFLRFHVPLHIFTSKWYQYRSISLLKVGKGVFFPRIWTSRGLRIVGVFTQRSFRGRFKVKLALTFGKCRQASLTDMASLDYCTVHEPLICAIRIRASVPLCFSGATLLQTCQRLLSTLWQTCYRGRARGNGQSLWQICYKVSEGMVNLRLIPQRVVAIFV